MGEIGLWVLDAYLNFLWLKCLKQTRLFIRLYGIQQLKEQDASCSILHRIPVQITR